MLLAREGRGVLRTCPAPHTPNEHVITLLRGVRVLFPFFFSLFLLLFFPLSLFPFSLPSPFSLSLDVDQHIYDGYFPDEEVMQIIPTATPSSTVWESAIHQQLSTILKE